MNKFGIIACGYNCSKVLDKDILIIVYERN